METIYVALLGQETEAWRPVLAQQRADDTYLIVSKNDDPEEEMWQFSSGSLVRCEARELAEGVRLVAVESVGPVGLRVV
jgi:hypothetical protein